MGFFSKLKASLSGADTDLLKETEENDYVQLESDNPDRDAKITVRPFVLSDFESIKPILDSLREGNTIALVNIKPLKDKDIVELKRAVSKLKKTCDAIEGDVAGFGEDWIAAVPSIAKIQRVAKSAEQRPQQPQGEVSEYGSRKIMSSSQPQSPQDEDENLKIEPY
ncbi:cell division protein SepF [Candidatus Woesearchaeota archaeon]|nr:cell division protein SepF [Candidatus Woesearchaeota archaeon]